MSQSAYSIADFLADESFQSFVFETDPAAVEFWRTWVLQHPAQEAEFDEAVAILQLFISEQKPAPEALKRAELAKLWQSMRPPVLAQPVLRSAWHRTRRWAVALVTAVVLLLAGIGLWRPVPAPRWTQYATQVGEHRQVLLPDGSRVVLNSNSVLRLATSWTPGQLREVWLRGEAYFSVRHTAPAALKAVAAAPSAAKFIVHAGRLDVAVLGTQFNVLNQAGRTKVVLSEGQIQLRRPDGSAEPLLMKPGELVEYDGVKPQAPLVKRRVKAALYSAWTSGQLDFDDTPAAEIIALLEDNYGLQITVGNPQLLQQKLTGSVPNQDVNVLLDAFARSLDAKVRREGNRVWLD
jgi:transmembrane sensor